CKDKRWDRFVENHPFGWVCHLSGWKKVLESSFPNIKGYTLAIEEKDKIIAGISIYEVKSWLTGSRLISIPFATLSDPLINSPEQMEALTSWALKLKEQRKALFLEIRTTQVNPLNFNNHFFKYNYYKHHYLTLKREVEEIKKAFHRSCVRQRITRAEKSGISIRNGETEDDLKDFYQLYMITRKRLALPPQPFKFFKSIWNIFFQDKKVELLLAQKNDKPIAGLLLFKFRKRVSAECAGSDERFNDLSPNHLLFWEAIRSAQKEGFEIFDFGRTSPLSRSLMVFKRRWGTIEIDLPIYFYPKEVAIKNIKKEGSLGYQLTQRLCKIIPFPYFEYLGRFIYRHLG
ncbi:MAG: lipid II:glycine glycyltransferase FemX, partial [Microgenomates group bacterium]